MYTERQKELRELLASFDYSHLFVHSDAFKSLRYIKVCTDKTMLLNRHVDLLESLVEDDGLILPAFNYQFPRERIFDTQHSVSQVGHISEFYRQNKSQWRTLDPMFSAVGSGSKHIPQKTEVNPFDENSIFAELVQQNACILFYGAAFNSATILHHVEYLSKVTYRYWKKFKGSLKHNGELSEITLHSHFRPMAMHLDYDWDRITDDLIQAGVLHKVNPHLMAVNAAELVNFWMDKLANDHLYLLDCESKLWVEPKLELLGRAFLMKDFEKE